jgi:hypothetical protein
MPQRGDRVRRVFTASDDASVLVAMVVVCNKHHICVIGSSFTQYLVNQHIENNITSLLLNQYNFSTKQLR